MDHHHHHPGLSLSLGFTSSTTGCEPCLSLSLAYKADHDEGKRRSDAGRADRSGSGSGGSGSGDLCSQLSPVSSFSVKREREAAVIGVGGEEAEVERVCCSRANEEEREDEDGGSRKKLRLSKEQSVLLEESFKIHSTLNPKQKQALAQQLNLRPRQVEVWFQNRRARTKLKQTEVDCDFWKKCCETLTDENRKLHKELQDLRALKLGQPPLYMQLPAAALTMCPSCERMGGGGAGASKMSAATTPSTVTNKTAMQPLHSLYNPFANPSAAC